MEWSLKKRVCNIFAGKIKIVFMCTLNRDINCDVTDACTISWRYLRDQSKFLIYDTPFRDLITKIAISYTKQCEGCRIMLLSLTNRLNKTECAVFKHCQGRRSRGGRGGAYRSNNFGDFDKENAVNNHLSGSKTTKLQNYLCALLLTFHAINSITDQPNIENNHIL